MVVQFPIRENLSNILNSSAPAEIQPFPASAEVVATIEESSADAWLAAHDRLVEAGRALNALFYGIKSLNRSGRKLSIDLDCPVVREWQEAMEAREL